MPGWACNGARHPAYPAIKDQDGYGEKRVLSRLLHGFNFFNADYYLGGGYSLPPKSVCLILSNACNLKCRMCDIGRANANSAPPETSPLVQAMHNGPDPMQREDWLSLVDQLSKLIPGPLLLLTGAEPFLAPHWHAVAEHILNKGLRLHITTNGTLLERCAEKLIAVCPHPTALDITVSLDALDGLHDRIRGVEGTFTRALEGIRAFAAAWARRGWHRPPVNITCTISNLNVDHLTKFMQGIVERCLPIRGLTFNHLWFRNSTIAAEHNRRYFETMPVAEENIQGVDINAINPDILTNNIRAIKKMAAATPFPVFFEPELSDTELRLYYNHPEQFVSYNKCTAAWRNIAITPSGSMILSPLCFLPPLDCVKGRNFREIWNAAPVRTMRKKIFRAGAYPACARCCMLFGSRPKYHKLTSLFRFKSL
jgi:Fe-coproporphyrin III synthase